MSPPRWRISYISGPERKRIDKHSGALAERSYTTSKGAVRAAQRYIGERAEGLAVEVKNLIQSRYLVGITPRELTLHFSVGLMTNDEDGRTSSHGAVPVLAYWDATNERWDSFIAKVGLR